MKTVQLRDGTIWDKCRSCGRTWNIVSHSSHGQCRGCRRQEKYIDQNIQSSQYSYSTLDPNLQKMLLVQETQNKYGYEISSLSYGCPSPIVHVCPECGLPKDNTPFKLFLQGKNLRHINCRVRQTRRTNQG